MTEFEWKALRDREIQFDPQSKAHGWIQWKGTDVCIDLHCDCGGMSHFDGDFLYFIQCPYCARVYEVNGHVEMIERDDPENILAHGYEIQTAQGDE